MSRNHAAPSFLRAALGGLAAFRPPRRTAPFPLGVASGCPRPTVGRAVDAPVARRRGAGRLGDRRGRAAAARRARAAPRPPSRAGRIRCMSSRRAAARPALLVSLHDATARRARSAARAPRPTATTRVPALRFAFASCQQYEQGYFAAWRHMAAEELERRAVPRRLHLRDLVGPQSGAPSQHGGRCTLLTSTATATRSTSPIPTCRPRTPRIPGSSPGTTTR